MKEHIFDDGISALAIVDEIERVFDLMGNARGELT
jgi:hypothetical protein